MSYVSVGSSTDVLYTVLELYGCESITQIDPDILQSKMEREMVKVFINGRWFGIHR